MNSGRIASLRNDRSGSISQLNDFMRTPGYVILLSVLTVISNLFALELALYTLFIAIGVYVMVCGRDFLPIMPLVVLSYIAPSPANNPGSKYNTGSIFLPENGGIFLIVLAAIFVVAVIFRLVTDSQLGGLAFWTKKRSLLGGMLLLCGGYLISGIGMPEYGDASWKFLAAGCIFMVFFFLTRGILRGIFRRGNLLPSTTELGWGVGLLLTVYALVGFGTGNFGDLPSRNLLFAFIQCVAVVVMYYLFSGGVDWKSVPKDYLAWVGMCAGFVVLPQLLENYLSGRIFMEGTGTIDRELIYAGWGMHNNIGGMMAFMLPFPFYLACTREKGWVYNLLGTILMLGVIVSCSRASMLVGVGIYVVCMVFVLRIEHQRKANMMVYGVVFGAVLVACLIFLRKLLVIFDLFFEEILIMSERDNLLSYGWKQFTSHPIFGGSFFPQGEYVPWDWSNSEAFSSFFPPRWHNTLIQMLASCGLVGFACYLWHRVQTVMLIIKKPSMEKIFIGLFLVSLLLCSLMDCHFFNVGPVLFYSMALAYAENINE